MIRDLLSWLVSPAYRQLLNQLRQETQSRATTEAELAHEKRLVSRWAGFAEGAGADRRRALDELAAAEIAVAELTRQLQRANDDYAGLAKDLSGLAEIEQQRAGLLAEIGQLRRSTGCRCAVSATSSAAALRATISQQEEMLAHYEGRPHGPSPACAGNCTRVLA